MLKDLCFEVIQTCPNKCQFCSSNSSQEKKTIITLEDFSNLQNVKFIYQGKEILDEKLKETYELPKYEVEDFNTYKEKMMQKEDSLWQNIRQ